MGALFVLGHDYSKWGFWFELGFKCGKAVQVESLDNVKTFSSIFVIITTIIVPIIRIIVIRDVFFLSG